MKLVLSLDGVVLKEITLEAEMLSIGRCRDNDIQIESPGISRQHAVIARVLDDAFLEDLDSTNGTYVNGRAVRRHALRLDDLIELGQYRLRYVNEVAALGASRMLVGQRLPDLPDQAFVVGALQVMNGTGAGQRVLLNKTETRLGQGGREALVVAFRESSYYLRYLSDAGPVVVNGAALDDEPRQLHSGDVIEISGIRLRFTRGPESP